MVIALQLLRLDFLEDIIELKEGSGEILTKSGHFFLEHHYFVFHNFNLSKLIFLVVCIHNVPDCTVCTYCIACRFCIFMFQTPGRLEAHHCAPDGDPLINSEQCLYDFGKAGGW